MLRFFEFNSTRASIFSGLPSRKGNSIHLDRIAFTWCVWKNRKDTDSLIVIYSEPENGAEEKSLKRTFAKIRKYGSLDLIYEDPSVERVMPNSDLIKDIESIEEDYKYTCC